MEKLKEGSVWSYSEDGNDGKQYTFISRNGSKSKFAKKVQISDSPFVSGYTAERNSTVEPNLFLPTNKIVFTEPFFSKRYPNGGVVKMVKRKNVYVHLTDTDETIGFDYQTMKKV